MVRTQLCQSGTKLWFWMGFSIQSTVWKYWLPSHLSIQQQQTQCMALNPSQWIQFQWISKIIHDITTSLLHLLTYPLL